MNQQNPLEDTLEKLKGRGHKATAEYSAGAQGLQLSKVSGEIPPRKTLWDWLQLLIVPLFIALVGIGFTGAQYLMSLQAANDQQQETILRTYLDDMSNLLLIQHLSTKSGQPVREMARERTLITLRRLNAGHNKIVLRFLQDAHLIGIQNAVISLSNVDLSNVDLTGIDLSGIDLSGDILNGAHLHGADLYDAHLNSADLDSADLSGADLSEAHLGSATLRGADLRGARLSNANLSGAFLGSAFLGGATLYSANLSGADLSNTDLRGAHLDGANLNGAELNAATLYSATLSDVDLSNTRDLTQPQLDAVFPCTIQKKTNLPTGLTCNHSDSMITLTYWYTEASPETPVILHQLIPQFEHENPNIRINAVNKDFYQAQAAFETASQAGQAPDVLRADAGWIPQFASQHYLLSIDSFASQSQLDLSAAYLPAPLKYDRYNGHYYGLPQVTDFLALLYNRAELTKAGITSYPATMSDFENAAMTVVQRKAATYGFETNGQAYYVLPFLWAFGGGMLDEHNHILVNNPRSIAGLNFLLNLQHHDQGVMPPPGDFSNGPGNMVNDFKSGNTAMIFDGPWDVQNILTGKVFQGNPDNLGIAAVPMGSTGNQPRSPAGGQSYVISADTAHPYESYKFISFMSSEENSQATIAQKNHTLPTLNSAYQDQKVRSDPLISAFSSSPILNTAHARPVIPQYAQLLEAFDSNIVAALDGTMSATDALNAVADAWKQLIPDAS